MDTGADIVAFHRGFDTFDTLIGNSKILDIGNDVALFESDDAAVVALEQVRTALTERPDEFFRGAIQVGAGIEASNFSGQTVTFPQLGDGTVTSLGFFDTAAGRAEGFFVAVRVGRFHNVMLAIAPQGAPDIGDMGPLLDLVNARIRASQQAVAPSGEPLPATPAPDDPAPPSDEEPGA